MNNTSRMLTAADISRSVNPGHAPDKPLPWVEQVGVSLNTLENELSTLQNNLDRMAQKMGPALVSLEPAPELTCSNSPSDIERIPLCDAARSIKNLTFHAERLNQQVEDLIHRIAL